jgi:hypothetical protein
VLRFSRCELLLFELVAEDGDSSGTQRKGERPSLEAATEQRLEKT